MCVRIFSEGFKMELPKAIKDALSKSSAEQKELFNYIYYELVKLGLEFHPDKPDFIMARHPINNINFIALRYGVSKGASIELRIDSLQTDILSVHKDTKEFSIVFKHWDRGKKPLWVIFRIEKKSDLGHPKIVIKKVMQKKPNWGRQIQSSRDIDYSQFLNTSADSLIYLREARNLFLEDTKKIRYPPIIHAAFCRMLAVEIISSIELLMKKWKNQSSTLRKMLKSDGNIEKKDKIVAAFKKVGVGVDDSVVEIYTATKILRNAIVHSEFGEEGAKYLIQNGFPTNLTKLNETHWDMMYEAFDKMMLYVSSVGINKR